MTHTKGPWEIVHFDNDPREKCVIVAGDKPIASPRYGSLSSYDEMICNAQLIASAPDLLDACERAFKLLTSAQCVPVLRGTVQEMNDCCKNLCDAINKARGDNV